MIYILDLHYSHKDAAVLALFEANYIIPIYIPAGCTDLHQVCDVCINKPYKNGVAIAFVDGISGKYAEWYNSKSEDDDIFKVDLSIGATKPLIPGYVARGISNLKTDAMKESIAQCMKNQGLLDEARLEASYQRALRVLQDTVVAVPDELEAEEDLFQDEDTVEIVNEEEFFEVEVNQEDTKEDES